MISKRVINNLSAVSLCLFLIGCASTGTMPEDHYYRLALNEGGTRLEAPLIPGVLRVERVKAPGLLRERALLYTNESSPEEVMQHRYHHWVDIPPTMIREQLIDRLREQNIAGHVVSEHGAADSPLRLGMQLEQLERVLAEGGKSASVALSVDVEITSDRERHPLLVKNYKVARPAADGSVLASVRAMNEGLRDIYDRMLNDFQTALALHPAGMDTRQAFHAGKSAGSY